MINTEKDLNVKWQTNGLDLERIQGVLFYIGNEVAQIFERHDIRYMIAYGTLLGAVRHQDLVPWDDDFDIFLLQDDYEVASEYLRKELPSNLFLEDSFSEPKYFHAWAHVKDLNSSCFYTKYPADDAYVHKGLHIDLYRLKKIKASNVRQYLIDENMAYLKRRKKYGLINEDDFKNRSESSFEQYEFDPASKDFDLYIFDGPYNQKTMIIEDAFPLKKYKIRNKEFWGPANADHVLKSIYGDYMKYPAYDDRKPKLDSVQFFE